MKESRKRTRTKSNTDCDNQVIKNNGNSDNCNDELRENISPHGKSPPTRKLRRSQTTQRTLTDIFGKLNKKDDHEKNGEDDENQILESEVSVNTPDVRDSQIEEEKPKTEESDDVSSKMIEDCEKTETKKTEPSENENSKEINDDSDDETEGERCPSCFHLMDSPQLKLYHGHPQNSVEEYIALTNDELVLTAGDECDIMERPHVNITEYTIYDRQGHLCGIDSGLIESDIRLFMSGYLNNICNENPEVKEESVPTRDIGPILEWSVHGFDGGQLSCITLSTEYGEYNLLKPSEDYMEIMNNLYERIGISKIVIEYLEEFDYLEPTYEDLLAVVKDSTIPELPGVSLNEEMLHKHARFICDQVATLEIEDEDDVPLITLPCMRELIKLFGIKFGKNKTKTKIHYKKKKPAKTAWTKATTTPIVRNTFETFFSGQIDKHAEKDFVVKKKRCGVCEFCLLPDCGRCKQCKAMAKFGGAGKTKKACIRRNCPNMAVEQAEESDPEDEEVYRELSEKSFVMPDDSIPIRMIATNDKTISFIGEPLKIEGSKCYYKSVKINDLVVTVEDFVMVDSPSPSQPHLLSQIKYMWKDKNTNLAGQFHGEMFIRGSQTVLGEVSNPREVFPCNYCCKAGPLSSILRLATVERRDTPKDWFKIGGTSDVEDVLEDDGKTYFYQKFYSRVLGRFEDLPPDPVCSNENRKHRFCTSCERRNMIINQNLPKVFNKLGLVNSVYEWEMVKWRNVDYKVGCAVFLNHDTFKLKYYSDNDVKTKLEKVDETIYTEYYRKNDVNMRGSNEDTVPPFCIGYISSIYSKTDSPLLAPQDIMLKLNIMYRPENIIKTNAHHKDVNMVYWSDDQKDIAFSQVLGLCKLVYIENIPKDISMVEWSLQDSARFYFKKAYKKTDDKICEVPEQATSVGVSTKKPKLKGKGKGKSTTNDDDMIEMNCVRPLKMLDVFAGCGGLSEGLHQSGVAVSQWAIENMSAAARAYQNNNPSCTVYSEDCNALLKAALDGETHSSGGLRLPEQGEVELLCGGPPCQGFSGMNRFNSREYSNFKNSLVATYLSYCDYYRPKYFILENVRNFVAFKKGTVLKLTLRCLLEIGYQCSFGILQAGQFGVPQTRRRLIIFAAAPGYKLPQYPQPTHVFSKRACMLRVTLDGKHYINNLNYNESAPKRTCTIRDAMSDLPVIPNGATTLEIDYGTLPETSFQKMMRKKNEKRLRDHICKNMAPLIFARMCRIPTVPGSDWRDLPNISVTLSDGTKSKVLKYNFKDDKNGYGPNKTLRGVCACASKGTCNPQDKQDNTLIPWCLPHTGNRHNHWAGLYGRLSWDGYFSTTVTDPEPMGKQGRVLHPEQNRVVSVRECARSQGFPDSYIFAGSIQDKHRQIGNAVPPLLGLALGIEIKKALAAST